MGWARVGMHGRRRRGRGELKGSGPTRQWPEHLPGSWLIWAASFAQCKGSRRQWRQTGGRRITVRRPLLPRVFLWGIQRWYLTAAKRVLSPVQRMLQMWFGSPNPHPRFRQSHSTVRFAVRVVVAIQAAQHRSHGGAVSSPGTLAGMHTG